jgi:cytochrome c-type biogenesis protein
MLNEISIGLAFLAGLASFLTPCVFSLVPAYISYLGGRSAYLTESKNNQRRITFTHGIAFVLGFSIVFILLGVAASALGSILYELKTWLSKIGGIVVVLFGLHMIGLIKIKYLEYDLRAKSVPDRNRGYLASALLGIFFSAGWSPCVGPVLGAILTLSLNVGYISNGVILLSAYSLGLAIPFLIAAYTIGWVSTIINKYSKLMRYVEIAMGTVLIIVGFMLFMGTFEQIGQYGFFYDFGL